MKNLSNKQGDVRPLTRADMERFKPAREVDPDLVQDMRRHRGQRGLQKAPLKTPVTLRLDPDILDWFKSSGSGYQTRMNDALREFIETH